MELSLNKITSVRAQLGLVLGGSSSERARTELNLAYSSSAWLNVEHFDSTQLIYFVEYETYLHLR